MPYDSILISPGHMHKKIRIILIKTERISKKEGVQNTVLKRVRFILSETKILEDGTDLAE